MVEGQALQVIHWSAQVTAKGSPGEILAKCTLRTFLFILSSIQCLPGDWRVLKALAMA